jgi:hypothetical protein
MMSAERASAGWLLRYARACVLATVALFTGVTAHASAGEALPAAWTLVLALGVVAVAVEPLLRQPASTRRVVALLAGGEMFIHLALTVISRVQPHGGGAMAGMHHMPGALTGRDALMVDAHLAAMAVVGLWLAAGERALWTLFSLAVRPFVSALGVLLDAPTWVFTAIQALEDGRRASDRRGTGPVLEAPVARRVTRRGPPVGAPRPISV